MPIYDIIWQTTGVEVAATKIGRTQSFQRHYFSVDGYSRTIAIAIAEKNLPEDLRTVNAVSKEDQENFSLSGEK